MKLGLKFNLILAAVFLGGMGIAIIALGQSLERLAEEEVRQQSQILLQTMNAVRDYTSDHIQPLIADLPTDELTFISETVPAFSARTVFDSVRTGEEYDAFFYKEATLNPTNPVDQADAFEELLVNQFRDDPGLSELSGFRTLFDQEVFYSARPLTVNDESCLACHGNPEEAPPALINTFGDQSGFGWELDEIVAAQIIYVPAGSVAELARGFLFAVLGIVIAVFAFAMLATNFLLQRTVVAPVNALAGLAKAVAADDLSETTFSDEALARAADRTDELGQLAAIFRQMAREVYEREQNLREQVRQLTIEIDEVRKAEQVEAITGTEYFQNLKERAGDLRARRQTRTEENEERE